MRLSGSMRCTAPGNAKWLPVRVGYDKLSLSFSDQFVKLDLHQIYRTVFDRNRFLFPAVIVVDYAMPNMNGIEFCEAIDDLPCKKILFSREASQDIAIDALKRGLIDHYLKKNERHSLDRLEVIIAELEIEFFQERSKALKELLVTNEHRFLFDESMYLVVEGLVVEHAYTEHYLFPDPPGLVLVDNEGKAKLLVVYSREGLMAHLQVVRHLDGPADLIEALVQEQVVPFFWKTGGAYTKEVTDWREFCLPANLCAGDDDFFWAVFDVPAYYMTMPIYPYNQYLTDMTPAQQLDE